MNEDFDSEQSYRGVKVLSHLQISHFLAQQEKSRSSCPSYQETIPYILFHPAKKLSSSSGQKTPYIMQNSEYPVEAFLLNRTARICVDDII